MTTGVIYVLHFDRPLHHARHYVGYARNLRARLQAHAGGRGSCQDSCHLYLIGL